MGSFVRPQRQIDTSHALRASFPACSKTAADRSSTSRLWSPRSAGVPNRYADGATKAAVIGLTKAVAADFIKQGIRANAICPGTIQSPSLDQRVAALAKASGQSREDIHKGFVDRQPLGRLGTPAEVAALAVFLASDESSYITGQAHLVDGGMAL